MSKKLILLVENFFNVVNKKNVFYANIVALKCFSVNKKIYINSILIGERN